MTTATRHRRCGILYILWRDRVCNGSTYYGPYDRPSFHTPYGVTVFATLRRDGPGGVLPVSIRLMA